MILIGLIAVVIYMVMFIAFFALGWTFFHYLFKLEGPLWEDFWLFCIISMILSFIF